MIEKLALVFGLAMLVGCTNTDAKGTSGPGAGAATAPADRFDGAAPDGQKQSVGSLGIPAGWQGGEFGEVRTSDQSGDAAAYDLPVFYAVAVKVKNDIKVVVIAVKEAARAKLDGDVGNLVRPLGS